MNNFVAVENKRLTGLFALHFAKRVAFFSASYGDYAKQIGTDYYNIKNYIPVESQLKMSGHDEEKHQ